MQLYMIRGGTKCESMQLPDLAEGQFPVYDDDGERLLFEVTGRQDGWHVVPVDPLTMIAVDAPLRQQMPTRVRVGENAQRLDLYLTQGGVGGRVFARCKMPADCKVTIGSAGDNELICSQPYMNRYHMELTSRGSSWQVTPLDRELGVFVNGKRCEHATALEPGDTVSVLEQRFIVLPGLLAFNSPERQAEVRAGSRIKPMHADELPTGTPFVHTENKTFFYRAPRFMEGGERESMTVDSPPAPHEPSQTNALLTMAPSLLGGLVSLAVTTNPLMPLATLAGATIFPMLNRRAADKQLAEDEDKRKAAYKAYLDDIEKKINDVTTKQEEALRKRLPPTDVHLTDIFQDKHKLWKRNSGQGDYLELRLGTGSIPLEYDITFPQDHFELSSDPMKQLMREVRDRERMLQNVPITLPLARFPSVGIAGRSKAVFDLAGNLILQLAADYGYDELKLCLIGAPPPGFDVFSWLPHTWDNARREHLIARNHEDLQHLLPILDRMLAGRENERKRDELNVGSDEPEIIFVIYDPRIAQSGVMTRMLFEHHYRGVKIVTLARHTYLLPRRCNAVIGVQESLGKLIWQEEQAKKIIDFVPEPGSMVHAERLVRRLANTYLDLPDTSSHIPDMVSFLDMFGVSDVNALNVVSRWRRNNPTISLATPVGVDEDGNICYLDVHEKGDGQHGLIAGMTGSGKSEFIMAYILSMAVNYSPEEVAFLLVDYKGGGMATAFADLPHTAGIMTNLDGNSLKRSMLAIQSELVRRQEIFHQTEQKLDITGLNIIKYQRLYREKRVDTPLPHLIFITDEFAELKAQEPEFMQKIISAARIGRSLGIHLILATQKPSGVVDDQIWSNTNWRVCLRVQDARDSTEVIKCPDAAELPGVGRMYIQVGHSMLKMSQSAYTGAPYQPGSRAVNTGCVDVLNTVGQVIQHSELPRTGRHGKTEYQINAVTKYLAMVARMQRMRCTPIWQPPLPDVIPLHELRSRYAIHPEPYLLTPTFGEIDDPGSQTRRLLTFSLSEGKNMMIYGGAESGKTMLLQTVLEDLMQTHSPDELNIYMMDYGDDGLSVYNAAPHVGDVVLTTEEEKQTNLLRMLIRENERRQKLLGGSLGGATLPERLKKANLPNILVVVHYLHVLKERMEDSAKLVKLFRDGPRNGIVFLGTTLSTSLLGYKIQDTFAQSLVLQMDRKDDYTILLGRVGDFSPEPFRGRGMIRQDALCEFQTATADLTPEELCDKLREKYPTARVPSIRVLPERVTAELLRRELLPTAPQLVPVGMDCVSLETVYLNLEEHFVHPIIARPQEALSFIAEWLPLLEGQNSEITVWGADDLHSAPLPNVNYRPVADTPAIVDALYDEIINIADQLKDGKELKDISPAKKKLLLVPSLSAVLDSAKQAQDDKKTYEKLTGYLGKVKKLYNCTLVIFAPTAEMTKVQFDKWFKTQVDPNSGSYFGRGIGSQHVMTVNNQFNIAKLEGAFPFGFDVRDAEPRRVKFLSDRVFGEGGE